MDVNAKALVSLFLNNPVTELNGFCFDREIPIPIYKDNSCLLYDGSTHTSVSDLWNIYVDSGKQEHLAKMALGYLQKKFTKN